MPRNSEIEEAHKSLAELEREHMKLFRLGMLLLIYFAVAFSGLAWEGVQGFAINLEAVPLGASILVCLFVAYVFIQAKNLTELRTSTTGMTDGPPSENIEK